MKKDIEENIQKISELEEKNRILEEKNKKMDENSYNILLKILDLERKYSDLEEKNKKMEENINYNKEKINTLGKGNKNITNKYEDPKEIKNSRKSSVKEDMVIGITIEGNTTPKSKKNTKNSTGTDSNLHKIELEKENKSLKERNVILEENNKKNREMNQSLKERNEVLEESNQKMEEMIKEYKETINKLKERNKKLEEKLQKTDLIDKSCIINREEEVQLIKNRLKETPDGKNKKIKLKLIFRLSRDGNTPAIFHSLCDNILNNLVLVKTKSNIKFGGYTKMPYTSSNKCKNDDEAFCFSLTKLKIYNKIKGNEAIGDWESKGPVFCNNLFSIGLKNSLNNGDCKKLSDEPNYSGEEEPYEINNGNANFEVFEIEFYQVLFE
jgi:myosin heavy subunit